MDTNEKEKIEKLRQDGRELVEKVLNGATKEKKRDVLMFICGFEVASLFVEKAG